MEKLLTVRARYGGSRNNVKDRRVRFKEVCAVYYYQFSREAKLLLVDYSEEKEEIVYNSNPYAWKMPQIGPRPPYYGNPRYEQYFPVI